MPVNNYGTEIEFEITVDGRSVNRDYEIASLDVSLNADAEATANFAVMDDAGRGLPIANSNEFTPGRTVEVWLGYKGSTKKVFSGAIYALGLSVNPGSGNIAVSCLSRVIPADKSKQAPALTLELGVNIMNLSTDARRKEDNTIGMRGGVSVEGTTAVVPGNSIEIKRVAPNVNGIYTIATVNHSVGGGTWYTNYTIDK